jgi:penicillin-insensitive murein endopeptidase
MFARIAVLLTLAALGGAMLAPSALAQVPSSPAASATPGKPDLPVPPAPIPTRPMSPVKMKPASAEPVSIASALALADVPLPRDRPTISQMTIPAGTLFAQKKLPSAGKSMAIGYYPRGCLSGGVELPVDGPTWQVMRLSRNRNWGHPELVKFLERFAPLAAKATGWNGILVGDMAQPRGGPLPYGHASHQVGLDVDIWFMPMPDHRLTEKERETISATSLVADDWKHVNPKTWTQADAAFIRTAAEQPEVERVFINAAIKKKLCEMQGKHHPAWMDKVRPWYLHHDHIHVRLKCPAGSPQCRSQPPVPGTDGCDKSLDYWFSDRVLHPKPPKHPKPKKHLMLADLPAACKAVLNAPPMRKDLAAERR